MADFSFIGTIVPIKASDKFKPYTEITNEKGTTKIFKFSVRCGADQHIVQFTSWTAADGTHRDIRAKRKENGKFVNFDVKWADRNKASVLAKTDEISKYILDSNPSGRVAEIEHLVEAFKDGSVTDEKMNKVGFKSQAEAEKALAEAKELRHECLAPADYIEFLKDFVEGKPEGKFLVRGVYELSQSNGNWYSSLKVKKITRYIDKEDEDRYESNLSIKMHIIPDSVDNEPDDKLVITGYAPVYSGKNDDGKNKYVYAPVSVVSYKTEDNIKKVNGYAKYIGYGADDDTEFSKEIGLRCRIHNGSERVRLTYDMLTDEQKEMVDFEIVTIEDIEKDMSDGVYGEKKTDIEILGFSKGFSGGSKITAVTVDEVNGVLPDELDDDSDVDLGI